VKTVLSIGLALVLLVVFARPACAHQFEPRNPEPDHVLYAIACILYPAGDILNHLLFGPHEKEGLADESTEEQTSEKPKYNFSPRKKHPEETKEESP
jgi:hypothetical protein